MELVLLDDTRDRMGEDAVSDVGDLAACRMADRRLSLRLSSLCSLRMASSIELVNEKRSAVASRAAMLPT